MRQIIGQQLIIGIKGKALEKDEADFIVQNNIGGICLFSRNIEGPQQLRALVSQIQSLRHKMPEKAPLLIAIDMEGGRVHRLPPPFTQWPAAACLGKIDSTSVAFRFASAMGEELRAMGINLNFAPCVDVLSNPANKAIGDRALGTDPELVSRLASALVRGYIKSDVIPCAKHFPGHGNTIIDSHDELPVENKTLAELDAVEMAPFKKVFRARLDMVMMAHIKYPAIDPDWPASLSSKIIQDIVRTQYRYRNLIISDDLEMKALTKNFDKKTIAVRALQAGINILLYCNEPDSPPTAIDAIETAVKAGQLDAKIINENNKRVLALKKDKIVSVEPTTLDEISRLVGHPDHLRLAKAIVSGEVPADLIANT